MKSIIDSFWALRDDVQHFRYSLVISVLLILIIISILLVKGMRFVPPETWALSTIDDIFVTSSVLQLGKYAL